MYINTAVLITDSLTLKYTLQYTEMAWFVYNSDEQHFLHTEYLPLNLVSLASISLETKSVSFDWSEKRSYDSLERIKSSFAKLTSGVLSTLCEVRSSKVTLLRSTAMEIIVHTSPLRTVC